MKILGSVLKSQSDQRIYRAIQLKNDLQCLIISDKDSFKSSAALSVGIGSLKDPMQAQGLAHYLQHMLFMGTKKYPDQNQYSNYITRNCGMSNAYTAQDLTNYHFQVASNAFEGSLDRFAQFFISPLMSDSSSERELKAVNSQHVKNLQSDMWKKYQLSKHIAKNGHPLKKFSTGNLQSLSNPNLREMLHKFYAANYSANLMKLVVYSNQNVDDLQKIVQQKFSQIPNHNYQKFQMKQLPYDHNNFQNIYKISPIKDRKTLQLVWTLSNKSKHYKYHPAKYLSHLFGHEGKGSLLSFLISEGLAFGLSSSYGDSFNCYNQFQVSISLTKKGVEKYQDIIGYTLNYLEMLKNTQPQKWVYDEIKNVNDMKLRYQQKRQGMMFTSGIARKLQQRQIQQVLVYPYFMEQWRPDLIKQYLSEMGESNLMAFLEAKQIQSQCNLVQPIYSTKYMVQNLNNLTPLRCNISLPQVNKYLPTDFSIKTLGDKIHPTKTYSGQILQGYFKKDHKFALPKIDFSMRLIFEGVQTPKQNLIRQIFSDMLSEKNRQFVYLADSAQINSNASFGNYFCLMINISGFRDSVNKFTTQYLQKIMDFIPDDQPLFQRTKQKFTRSLNNYFLGDPFRMAYSTLQTALREGQITPQARLQQINSIKLQDIVNFSKKWKNQLKVESLLTGNIQQNEANTIFQQTDKFFKKNSEILPKNKIKNIRTIKLSSNFIPILQKYLISKQQQNSSVIVHFQNPTSIHKFGQVSEEEINYRIKQSILHALCYNFIKQPTFDYLRTKQQLGYIVMCLPQNNRGVIGMSILVQSAVKTSYEIVEYIDKFIYQIFSQKLSKIDQITFEQYRNSLLISRKEADKNLSEESNRFWAQILKNQYVFDRKQRQIQQLNQISLSEMKNFFQSMFYTNSRRFEVHMISQRQKDHNKRICQKRLKENNIKIFKDVQEFRKGMQLYPDFYCKL